MLVNSKEQFFLASRLLFPKSTATYDGWTNEELVTTNSRLTVRFINFGGQTKELHPPQKKGKFYSSTQSFSLFNHFRICRVSNQKNFFKSAWEFKKAIFSCFQVAVPKVDSYFWRLDEWVITTNSRPRKVCCLMVQFINFGGVTKES